MTINVNYRLQQINFKFGAWYGSQGFGMYELLQPEKSVFFFWREEGSFMRFLATRTMYCSKIRKYPENHCKE